ncbi:MAG TPA: DNA-3-methyladenine glycosylase [Gemmatimonadaceae bacterium]|nr:DNA-3-methyladenine glycosylase [Gemmatimonadaceae bacterium]
MSASAARLGPRSSAGASRTRPAVGAPLPRSFYARDTERVARDLLGAILIAETPDGVASGRIVETEAYLGEHDGACHAAVGRTARTEWLYGEPGTAYVYFIYGAHWCVNAVTRRTGLPSAVLLRALEPIDGIALMRWRRGDDVALRDLANGPGKLCAALGITGALNGARLDRPPLRIIPGESVRDDDVAVTARVGIARAVDWPLRFLVRGSPFVSRGVPGPPRRRRRTAKAAKR